MTIKQSLVTQQTSLRVRRAKQKAAIKTRAAFPRRVKFAQRLWLAQIERFAFVPLFANLPPLTFDQSNTNLRMKYILNTIISLTSLI